jgi:hypothetical protein
LFIVALVACPAMAQPKKNTLKYTEYGKIFYGEYVGWGPALFYDEPVAVVYTCTNRWTITETDDWVRWHYSHVGVAEVYGAGADEILWTGDDVLLDTRPFTVSQSVKDEGRDGSTRYGPTTSTTDPGLEIIYYLITDLGNIENQNYEWMINGVYHYQMKTKDGVTTVNIWPS